VQSPKRDRLIHDLTQYGLAASLVAATNAIQLVARLGQQLRWVTRVRVVVYDVLLFLLLGGCIAVLVWSWSSLTRRLSDNLRPWAPLVAQLLLGGWLGATILANDFANFVGKHEIPLPPAVPGALVGAAAGLLATRALPLVNKPWHRQSCLFAALIAASANARILPGNYPGLHLLVAVSSLLLFSTAISTWVQQRCGARMLAAIPAAVVFASVAVLLLPPSRIVRQNLGTSAGSAVVPFALPWLPEQHSKSTRRLAVEQTEWFRPRSAASSVPAHEVPWFAPYGSVLLLTVDALRADVIEGRKYDTILPNLARLRDASLRFTSARSPSPSTTTTVTSLLTGKYYSQIYFTEYAPGKVNPITDQSVRVPELLVHAGILAVNVRALWSLGPDNGVGRGFNEEPKTERDYGHAEQVMDLILGQVERLRREPKQRLFLYSHFVDSHAPYTLGGKRATPFDSYLAELELVDRQLGRLLEQIATPQLASRCLLIVSADHGEAFGEHDTRFHANTLYEELLRVPLMFYHPALASSAKADPVTLVDLGPTLLDLFGVATPGDYMGQSLVPMLLGTPGQFTRPIAADSGRRMQALFFADGMKVIRDLTRGTVQVFDLRNDPAELRDLTDGDREVEPYILAMEHFFEVHTLKVPGWKPPWRSF